MQIQLRCHAQGEASDLSSSKFVERLWGPLSHIQWVPDPVYPGGNIARREVDI
jgi:hypothetical protein